jgi:uncharacterized membrane protein
MGLTTFIETVGKSIDAVGVTVIAVGAVIAAAQAVLQLSRRNRSRNLLDVDASVYKTFRRQLGASILLGLEFLVAADIIRTVAVTPEPKTVAVLAGIVLIRTFLSFSLELEVTGYWPWQAAKAREERRQQALERAHPTTAVAPQ